MEVDGNTVQQTDSAEVEADSEPRVVDVTEELDGYEAEDENEQLPDEIEEPDDEMSEDTDLANVTQDEASLIKGFRDLSTTKKKESRQLIKRQAPKRSYSQMVSETDSDSYIITTMSRAPTPSKRREIRRLKAVYHLPATPAPESDDDNNMDIDVSSPVPRSEGF